MEIFAKEVLTQGYGFIITELTQYCVRIYHHETKNWYDWFHTTGTIMRFDPTKRKPIRLSYQTKDIDDIANFINKFERDITN